jgi:hypothetical protein
MITGSSWLTLSLSLLFSYSKIRSSRTSLTGSVFGTWAFAALNILQCGELIYYTDERFVEAKPGARHEFTCSGE